MLLSENNIPSPSIIWTSQRQGTPFYKRGFIGRKILASTKITVSSGTPDLGMRLAALLFDFGFNVHPK